jgi:hypothetical protein
MIVRLELHKGYPASQQQARAQLQALVRVQEVQGESSSTERSQERKLALKTLD